MKPFSSHGHPNRHRQTMVDLERRPRPHDRVVTQEVEDTVVLLDPTSGEYFSLSDTGRRVWQLCDGTRAASEICEALAREYDAPLPVIQEDVLQLLSELMDARLLV